MWTSSVILCAVSACIISLAQALEVAVDTGKLTQKVLHTSDNVVLKCTGATDAVSWKWFDGPGVTLPASAKVQGNQIVLNPIGQNGGRYECESGGQSAVYTLNVASRNMLKSPELVVGNGTTNTKLECPQLFSSPFPLIWTFPNGTDISMDTYPKGDNRVYIDSVEKGSALYLRSGIRSNAILGDYRCRLNTTGSNLPAEVLTELAALSRSVMYEALPDVRFDGATTMKNATKGEAFALKCIVEGHESDHIKWYKTDEDTNNVTVLLDAPVQLLRVCSGSGIDTRYCLEDVPYTISQIKALESITMVLHFDQVQDSDRGIYTCEAYNRRGASNASTTLRVINLAR